MGKNDIAGKKRRSPETEERFKYADSVRVLLTREDEMSAAKNIAELEQALWEAILGDRAKARIVLARMRDSENLQLKLEESQELLEAWKKAAKLYSQAISKKRNSAYRAFVSELASKLCEMDTDRILVSEAAREAILQSGKKDRNGRVTLSPRGRAVKQALSEVNKAKHDFIRANQGLVALIAKRYKQSWIPLNDLMQEGNLGLMKAVNRFDYTKGFQFCTYASWWIRASISRAIDNKESIIRIPGSQLRTRSKFRKAVKSCRQRLGRNPTDREIAVESGLGSLRLERVQRHLVTRIYSLDQEISESNNLRYVDVLTDDGAPNPLEKIHTAALAREVGVLLERLTPLERNIISQRFGFEDFEASTLREIGEQYGLSRERIRQIQNRALGKIRSGISLDAA